jgi:eukaryotic-like serine/threonine-protein kinase
MRRIIREREPMRPSTRLTRLAPAAQSKIQNRKSKIEKDLDWIVMKCLEKDRSRRYETANGLAADLKRHLTNEPVVARPPSVVYRLQKAWRRNKVVYTAATTVAAALVVGFGISAWQATVAARERDNAVRLEREREVEAQIARAQRDRAEAERQRAETERTRANDQAHKATASELHARRMLYVADINLAQHSLRLNNLGRSRRLLDRHRPEPGEQDLRGWEWRYLWQLSSSSAIATLTRGPVRGLSVAFSSDGSRLAVGWEDGRVELWDVESRRRVGTLLDGESRWPGARVAFSPVRNLVVTPSGLQEVMLFDLDADRQSTLWQAPQGEEWMVHDIAFSNDGSRVVVYVYSRENGGQVHVVHVSTSEVELSRPAVSVAGFFGSRAARLAADNQHLFLSQSDGVNFRIECLHLATGEVQWQTEPRGGLILTAIAASPDGRFLATASGYEHVVIHVWDAESGRQVNRLDGHTGWVADLVFTEDAEYLVSGASDQTIRIWDTSDWSEVRVLRGHTDEVHSIAVSKLGKLVASAGKDRDVKLWKMEGGPATETYIRLPDDLDARQVVILDEARVLLLPSDRPPALMDLNRGASELALPDIASSPDVLGWSASNLLFHWNGTDQILIHELRGSRFLRRGAVQIESGIRPSGLAYNPHRQLLAWSEGPSSASIWLANLATDGLRMELRSDVPELLPFRFSDNGNHLVARTPSERSLRVWNVESGRLVVSIDERRIIDAAFALGGRTLVASLPLAISHEIGFYDLAPPGQAPRFIPGKEASHSLAVSPDGRLVAVATHAGTVPLFDAERAELAGTLHEHLNAAVGVAFSPDGRRLISSGTGREAVKLWDVDTQQELLNLPGAGSRLTEARWTADGNVILAGPPWQAWRAPSWEEIEVAE